MKAKSVASASNANYPALTQTSKKGSLYSATLYPSRSQRHAEINNAITYHLAKDMCPINPVSNVKHSPALNYSDSVAFCDGIFILANLYFGHHFI
jgi:hypothetical protein